MAKLTESARIGLEVYQNDNIAIWKLVVKNFYIPSVPK